MKKRRGSLKTTLIAICVLLSMVICVSMGFTAISFIRSSTNSAYEKYETAMYDGYKTEIKSQVQNVLAILELKYSKVQAMEITEEEAKKEVIESCVLCVIEKMVVGISG